MYEKNQVFYIHYYKQTKKKNFCEFTNFCEFLRIYKICISGFDSAGIFYKISNPCTK